MTDEPVAPAVVEALLQAIEDLRRDRDRDRAVLEQIQSALIGGAKLGPTRRQFPDWTSWVDEWLTQRISRRPQRLHWCHAYREHPDVADRLESLWHTWEAAWPEPSARTGWFRDGLDHHLAVIGADDGPLRDCSALEDVHRTPAPLGSRTTP